MIKVCILTSVHPPFDTRIFHKEAKSLAKAGYDVSLVAQHDKEETVDGIRIIPLQKPQNRLERMTRTVWQVYRKALNINADIYHLHDPELFYIGLLLKYNCSKAKVIFDMHEMTDYQINLKDWLYKPIRKPISRIYACIEKAIVRKLDALVVPQPYMLSRYSDYNETIVCVENFTNPPNFIPCIHEKKKIIFHVGTLSEDRGLFNMLDVMFHLKNKDVVFVLAGDFGSSLLFEKVKAHPGWEKVDYVGRLSPDEVKKYYLKSTIGLILYNNVGQYFLSYATKLFEYMRYGIPVVMPNFGEWTKFNNENNCGICVNVNNAEAIACIINELFDNTGKMMMLGTNGRKAIESKYNWSIAEKRLLRLYRDLICKS